MDDAELLFLIWRLISSGPLAGAAQTLEEQATRLGLLPSRVDIAGQVHPVSFAQYGRVHQHVPADALRRLLQKLLEQIQAANPDGGLQVNSLTAPGKHGLLGCEDPPLPHWWRRPHAQVSLPHQLLLRQTGLASSRLGMPGSAHGSSSTTGLLCRMMRHLTTVRGHRLAVYCCTYDNTGRRVITGSDDYLVKIWSAETGTLLKSCRGHDAEITDFAVSRDNSVIASGDMAHSVRIWSLQEGTLGWPVSVLNGHTNVVSYLDFHPQLNDTLLSCSTDGTCRIWNARDPGVAALVLRPSAVFGVVARQGQESPGEGEPEEAVGAAGEFGTGEDTGGGTGGSSAAHQGPSRAGSMEPISGGGAPAGSGGQQPASGLGRAGTARGSVPPPGSAAGMFGSPPPPLPHQHEVAAAPLEPNRPPVGFLCCSWSPDGAFIFAGGTDCTVCVWHWDLEAATCPAQVSSGLPSQLPPKQSQPSSPQPQQDAQQQQAEQQGQGQELPPDNSHSDASPQAAMVAAAATGGSRPAEPHGRLSRSSANSLSELFAGRDWPLPTEMAKLSGHRNDIVFIEFSHEGSAVATASRDGCVKIWRLERDRRRGRLLKCWREAMSLACPPTEEEIRKARLKRKPPPHPAINQVAWNLDDSRMVAAVTDNSVRVWDTASGTPTHILLEHSAQAHVLEAHPQDPRLVMSGGYDGRTILWDVIAGVALKMFSSQDTFPGRGRWTDPIQLVDGHFAADGAQLAVTDTAGQLHLYGVPVAAASEVMSRVPYDQFLGTDYNGLVRDMNGWVLDELTQQPPHLMTSQTLCDYSNHPYSIEIQAAFVAHRFSDLPRPHPVDRDHPLPPALLTHPPTLVSASWLAVENGSSAAAIQQAMNRAYDRHMQALEALSRPDDAHPRGGRRSSAGRNGGTIGGGAGGGGSWPSGEPPRRPLSGAAVAAPAAVAATNIPRGVYLIIDDPSAPPPPLLLRAVYDSDDGHRHGEPSSSSSSDGGDDDVVSISDPGCSGSSEPSDDDDEPIILVDSDDGRPISGRGGWGSRGGRGEGSGLRERGRGGGSGSASRQGDGPTLRRSSRRERADAREQAQQERIRRSARLSGHKRRYGDGDEAPDSNGTDDEQQLTDEQLKDDEYGDTGAEEDEPEDDEDDSGDDEEVRRRQRRAASRRQRERVREQRAARRAQRELRNQQRREQRREERWRRQLTTAAGRDVGADPLIGPGSTATAADGVRGPGGEEDEEAGLGSQQLKQVAKKRSHEAGGSRPRPLEAYAWLQCTSYVPDYHCPQLGEEVVYIRAGHEAYLGNVSDKRAARPWWQLPGMRPSEPCIITELSFEILRDGAYHTAANLKLMVDPASGSPVAGKAFSLQLPPPAPPNQQQAEFLVPLSRFSRAVAKRWRIGERCKTYQRVEGAAAGGGRWYAATIVYDRMHPELTTASEEPPPLHQPHECEKLWERYSVVWDGEAETTHLSPWEMLPLASSWDEVVRYARATAAAKADEIMAAAATSAATTTDGGAGPSTSSNPGGNGGGGFFSGPGIFELHLGIGGGWAEEQASAARLALERLLAEARLYGLFVHDPPQSATFPCSDGDRRPVPYNAIVPLPMSLELMEQRLDNSFYHSLAAVRHDIDTIVANAERFNGADSDVAQHARDMRLHFTAALTGRCVDDVLLFGSNVIIRRRRRHMAAPRGRRADLSRLWMLVALDLEDMVAEAQEEADVTAAAAGAVKPKVGSRRSRWTGVDAIRGGADAAGGVTGPRRRGGLWVPPPPALSSPPGMFGGGGSSAANAAANAAPVVVTVTSGPLDVDAGMVTRNTATNPARGNWALEAAGGGGGGGDLVRGARGRFASTRSGGATQRQQQRYRGNQQDEDDEVEDEEEEGVGHLASPSGRSRQHQRQRRQQQQQQEEEAPSRPRRERARVPGRFGALQNDSEESNDSDEELAAAEDSEALDGETSSSDVAGRGRRRRQPQRGQGRQQRQRQPPQPLRRSSRARQRPRYGSDWEDEVPDQSQGDSDSEDDEGNVGGDGGGGVETRRRSGRSAGGCGKGAYTGTASNAARAAAIELSKEVGYWPAAAQPMPPADRSFQSWLTEAAAQPLQRQPEVASVVTVTSRAAAAAAVEDQADVRMDGSSNRAVPSAQGRLKIRLRSTAGDVPPALATPTAADPALPPCAAAFPPTVQSHAQLHGQTRCSGGGGSIEAEEAAGRPGPRRPQRGFSATAPALPQPLQGGRSRRAAAVAAVAAVAAAAAAADRSEEDGETSDGSDGADHDTLPQTRRTTQQSRGLKDSSRGVGGTKAAAAANSGVNAAAGTGGGGSAGAGGSDTPYVEQSNASISLSRSFDVAAPNYQQQSGVLVSSSALHTSAPAMQQMALQGAIGVPLQYSYGARTAGAAASQPLSAPPEEMQRTDVGTPNVMGFVMPEMNVTRHSRGPVPASAHH